MEYNKLEPGFPGGYFYALGGCILVGTAIQGIFASWDRGNTWSPASKGILGCSIEELAADSGGTIFAGTSNGVYSTTNEGEHWELTEPLPVPAIVYSLLVEPNGYVFAGSNVGVFRSTDGGASWKSVNNGFGWESIIYSPTDSYIATFILDRLGRIFATSSTRTFISTDHGDNWSVFDPTRYVIGMCQQGILLDLTGSTISRSTDNGLTWQRSGNLAVSGGWGTCLAADLTGNVLVGAGFGLARSTDNGLTWIGVSRQFSYLRALIATSRNNFLVSSFYYQDPQSGIYRSTDHGDGWMRVSSDFAFTSFASSPTGEIIAGSGGKAFRSVDDGISWSPIGGSDFRNAAVAALALAPNGVCYAGTDSGVFRSVAPETGIGENRTNTPSSFVLEQNYPNPFNPGTTIAYSVPKPTFASLRIFNTLGQEVASLVNEQKSAGTYRAQWNASVPSGIYFYRLQAGEYGETKKMILLR